MPCLKSARTKLPHTSYKQQHKSVYHWVLEAYSFFAEAQNRMVNPQDIRTRRSFEFEKARVFLLFPYLCFLSQISENIPIFLFFARQHLFLMFSLTILRGKLAREWPEVIPSRMPNVWRLPLRRSLIRKICERKLYRETTRYLNRLRFSMWEYLKVKTITRRSI